MLETEQILCFAKNSFKQLEYTVYWAIILKSRCVDKVMSLV